MKRNKIILKTTLPKSNKKGIIESNKEVIPEGEIEEIAIPDDLIEPELNPDFIEPTEDEIGILHLVESQDLPSDKDAFIWDDKVITQKKDESEKPKKKRNYKSKKKKK